MPKCDSSVTVVVGIKWKGCEFFTVPERVPNKNKSSSRSKVGVPSGSKGGEWERRVRLKYINALKF